MTQEIDKKLKEVTGFNDNEDRVLQPRQTKEYDRLKSALMFYPTSMHNDILCLYERYNHLTIKSANDKTLKKVKKQLGEAASHYKYTKDPNNDNSENHDAIDAKSSKCSKNSNKSTHLEIWYTQTKGKGTKNRKIPLPLTPPKTQQFNEELLLYFIGCFFRMEGEFRPNLAIEFLSYLRELCEYKKVNFFILSSLPPLQTEGVSPIEYANKHPKECISPKRFIEHIFNVEIDTLSNVLKG